MLFFTFNINFWHPITRLNFFLSQSCMCILYLFFSRDRAGTLRVSSVCHLFFNVLFLYLFCTLVNDSTIPLPFVYTNPPSSLCSPPNYVSPLIFQTFPSAADMQITEYLNFHKAERLCILFCLHFNSLHLHTFQYHTKPGSFGTY